MEKIVSHISELIGETPLFKLTKVVPSGAADVYVKLESLNIGHSIKDRVVLNILEVAEEQGKISPSDAVVEVTDGNASISLAMLAAAKGYRSILVMPEGTSAAYLPKLSMYDAEVIETPESEGINGAIKAAVELSQQDGYFYLNQYRNLANTAVHEGMTGPEIVDAFDGKYPDSFVATAGTGGTLTGVGKYLRAGNPNIELYAVETEEAPILSNELKGESAISGISSDYLSPLLDQTLYNGVIRISSQEAVEMTKRLAREEGLLLALSSGAAIAGAIEIAKKLGTNKKVITISNGDY
ncbi:MAG TPA: PLP-dependent cysteine synthase family protein [Candidatus Jeotgalibaca pullicola]|nr:PLP-dependent cysteine synthase family protein [Candidatus Jeotgalibaca pullicola]